MRIFFQPNIDTDIRNVLFVIPAEAGIQESRNRYEEKDWILAFARMTTFCQLGVY